MNLTVYLEEYYDIKKNYLVKTLCAIGGAWAIYRLLYQYREILTYKRYQKAIRNFPRLSIAESLVAKYLKPDVYAKLYPRRTSNGITIDQILQARTAKVNQPSKKSRGTASGLLAGDDQCYDVFSEVFLPLIHEIHQNFCPQDDHVSDMDFSKLGNVRFNEDYVMSCSVKAVRSVRGCCLPPCMSRAERKDIARRVKYALEAITGDIEGEYYPIGKILDKMEELWKNTTARDLLYHPSSRFWVTSALTEGRGAWMTKDFRLLVLVNISEHIKVISTDRSGDLVSIFERFCFLIKMFEVNLRKLGKEFVTNQHLGNITSDIGNLGTGMTVCVDVKLPLLTKDSRFLPMLEKLRLHQFNVTEDSESGNPIYELSNIECLGISEVEIVKTVFDGVSLLVDMERRLEQGMKIDDLIIWKDS